MIDDNGFARQGKTLARFVGRPPPRVDKVSSLGAVEPRWRTILACSALVYAKVSALKAWCERIKGSGEKVYPCIDKWNVVMPNTMTSM